MISNKVISEKWFEAFNQHDLESLLSLYSENAIHFSPKLLIKQPETKGLIKGKSELRKWWKESFDNLPSLKYFPKMIICEGENVFMKYKRTVDGQNDLIVGETLKIVEGVIVESRVYHS
jgi:ketosteroid isomerase-like protein